MKVSDFVFDYVNLLYNKRQKINLKCNVWYIDSPDWIKNKKPTINPINDDDHSFQYAGTIALNHEKTGKNSQRI